MSRPWISSQERRGIVVILGIIGICATVAGVRRCSAERRASQLYLEQQAHLDSVSSHLDSVSSSLDAPFDTVDTGANTFVLTSGSNNEVSMSEDSLKAGKPRVKSRKSNSQKLSSSLPTRSPIDEPVN